MANIGSTGSAIPDGVFYEVINQRSIKYKPPAQSTLDSGAALSAPAEASDENIIKGPAQQVLLLEPTWTQPFLAYLLRQELPEDQDEARRIVRRLKAYTVVAGKLYKRSISGIFQRCIALEDRKSLLREIHEGTCGHHASNRALVAKTFRAGF